MNSKYQNLKSRVNSPEDFIELCATRSLMTGKPYEVVTADGDTMLTGEWLRKGLADYRNERKTPDEQPVENAPDAMMQE
jgi:ribosome biogenesis GTPase A